MVNISSFNMFWSCITTFKNIPVNSWDFFPLSARTSLYKKYKIYISGIYIEIYNIIYYTMWYVLYRFWILHYIKLKTLYFIKLIYKICFTCKKILHKIYMTPSMLDHHKRRNNNVIVILARMRSLLDINLYLGREKAW